MVSARSGSLPDRLPGEQQGLVRLGPAHGSSESRGSRIERDPAGARRAEFTPVSHFHKPFRRHSERA